MDLPDAAIVLDDQGVLRWGNHAAERLFGRVLDESVGLSALDLVHPDDLEMVLRSFASVQRKEVGTLIEVGPGLPPLATARGHRCPGRLVRRAGSSLQPARDLTERRRFEVADNREARFRLLVDKFRRRSQSSSHRRAGWTGSRAALSRMLGHDPELVERRPLAELVVEADRAALTAAFARARRRASAASPVIVDVRMLRHLSAESVPFELSIVNLVEDPTVGVSSSWLTTSPPGSWPRSSCASTLSLLTAAAGFHCGWHSVVNILRGRSRASTVDSQRCGTCQSRSWPRVTTPLAIEFVMGQLVNPEEFEDKVGEVYASPDVEINDILEVQRRPGVRSVFETPVGRRRHCGPGVDFRYATERKRLENELFTRGISRLAHRVDDNKVLFQDRLHHAVARCERTNGASPFCSWTWTTSRTSTTVSVTPPVTSCSGPRPWHCEGAALRDTAAASAVTSSRSRRKPLAVFRCDKGGQANTEGLPQALHDRAQGRVWHRRHRDTFSGPGVTSDQLLRNADLAMYAAKERGKNRFAEFDERSPASPPRFALAEPRQLTFDKARAARHSFDGSHAEGPVRAPTVRVRTPGSSRGLWFLCGPAWPVLRTTAVRIAKIGAFRVTGQRKGDPMPATYDDANLVLQLAVGKKLRWACPILVSAIFCGRAFYLDLARLRESAREAVLQFGCRPVGALVKHGVLDQGLVLDLWVDRGPLEPGGVRRVAWP